MRAKRDGEEIGMREEREKGRMREGREEGRRMREKGAKREEEE